MGFRRKTDFFPGKLALRTMAGKMRRLSPQIARSLIDELQTQQQELERRNTELQCALTTEHGLLLTLINTIPHRIFVKDRQGRFTLNNTAHIAALGAKSQAEVTGKTDYDFRPAELADRYWTDDQRVLAGEALIDYEEPCWLPSGKRGTLLICKAPLRSADGEVAGLVGISSDITERKRMERELQLNATQLEQTVERRTQELFSANQELTAMNQQIMAMNESLEVLNQNLAIEIAARRQKEKTLLLREKQYRAITGLLTRSGERVDDLLRTILEDAIKLIGAPGGDISLVDENGKNFIFRHTTGINREASTAPQPLEQGMMGQVYRSGEMLCVEDYRRYPYRMTGPLTDRFSTVMMVPLELAGAVTGVLTANWQDAPHPVSAEDREVFRQYGILASIALERAHADDRIAYQNQLRQKLAEMMSSLVQELDLEKTLQNILLQATAFMGVAHGFIQLFDADGNHANLQCGMGRYAILAGNRIQFAGKGIFAEILSTGRSVIIDDYARWPGRLPSAFYDDATLAMQSPLCVEGQTIGSIGLTAFGDEPLLMRRDKLAIFEQFATVAAIAVKNALAHQKTRQLALHDTLTGLPNREHLNRRLKAEMELARCGDAAGAVMFIDLDDLKMVNDHFGHSYGDSVIMATARDITAVAGPGTFVARVGGDEFVIILPGADLDQVAQTADRLIETIRKEYTVQGQSIHMSTSIGITLYPVDAATAEDSLKNADIAMYAAKAAGKSNWRFFEPGMLKNTYDQLVLTNSLRQALDQDEFYLDFQPQIALAGRRIVGFEALIRWNSWKHGRIMPGRFIPLAEQRGLIQPIGRWVIAQACRFARELTDLGHEHLHVAVNVSAKQLADADFVCMVRRSVEEAGISPAQLEIEITESVLIDSLEESTRKLIELSAMGIRLSLDDFGTGFSSLTYLRSLPVGTLKIDKSFIDGMLEEKVQEGFLRSIIDMAHVLGLTVIAEGVETEPQLVKLAHFDCDCVQGYVFSKPVSLEEAIELSIRSSSE